MGFLHFCPLRQSYSGAKQGYNSMSVTDDGKPDNSSDYSSVSSASEPADSGDPTDRSMSDDDEELNVFDVGSLKEGLRDVLPVGDLDALCKAWTRGMERTDTELSMSL